MPNSQCVTTVYGVVNFGGTRLAGVEVRYMGRVIPPTCLQAFNVSQSSLLTRELMKLLIHQHFVFGHASSKHLDGWNIKKGEMRSCEHHNPSDKVLHLY